MFIFHQNSRRLTISKLDGFEYFRRAINYKASTRNYKSSAGKIFKNAINDVKKTSSNSVITVVTKKKMKKCFHRVFD